MSNFFRLTLVSFSIIFSTFALAMQTPLQTIPYDNLKVGELLGHGGYGDVYKATWHGTDVAIKQLHLKTLPAHLKEEFEYEAQMMAQCQFPNIINLYGVITETGHHALVMELMPKGSLHAVLKDKHQELGWDIRWMIAIDIGKGLSYLHNKKIIHRDLKSHNVLLGNDYHAKICDFGLSKVKLESSGASTKNNTGTVRWRAPETFKRGFKPANSMDIYSYGMVLWEIAAREDPFADALDEQTVISWIKDGEKEIIPTDCPPAYGDMILETWEEAEKRPNAERIVMVLTLAKPEPALEISPKSQKNYVAKSWHFDPATERQAALAQDDGKPYKLLEATEKDKQRVVGFYQHHPVPGYEVGDVKVIYNRDFNVAFEVQIRRLQQKDNNPAFKPKWDKENNAQWRAQTAKKLEELSASYTDHDYPAVKIIPLWHGTKPEILDSIFRIGYANLALIDNGFFGAGLYGAHEAEYSHRVYGKGALILNWVASFSAYPVIDGDMSKLAGKGNYPSYDAHFVPVVPQNPNNPNEVNYYPCKPKQKNTYTELVTFDTSSCLPRYLVELRPSGPQPSKPSPLYSPAPQIQQPINLFTASSQSGFSKQEQELKAKEQQVKELELKLKKYQEQELKEQQLKEEALKAQAQHAKDSDLGLFVSIPGGTYEIGSPPNEKGRYENEKLHSIKLGQFSIMDAAVTQESYARLTGTNPSNYKESKYCPKSFKEIDVNGVKISVCADHPVEMVSWDDAKAFAQLMSKHDSQHTYNLPTEAQLEVAFRGGTKTAYVTGRDDDQGLVDYVWYRANSESQTHPVKSIKFANKYGIWRSSVWEWAQDWYDAGYAGSTGLDPRGPTSGSGRVLRGGSWFGGASGCRSAARGGNSSGYRSDGIGFRLVRT